jgi:hypothetical protein
MSKLACGNGMRARGAAERPRIQVKLKSQAAWRTIWKTPSSKAGNCYLPQNTRNTRKKKAEEQNSSKKIHLVAFLSS